MTELLEPLKRRRGPPLSDDHKRKISKALTGRRLSDEHVKNASQARKMPSGPDHPNWRGGIYKNVGEKEYMKKYVRTPEAKLRHSEQCRKHNKKLKIEVLTHYGNGKLACVVCGEARINCLSIDHIKGDGAKHRREIGKSGGRSLWYWLKRNGYPEGYQTLCMNDQWIKRHENKEFRHGGVE